MYTQRLRDIINKIETNNDGKTYGESGMTIEKAKINYKPLWKLLIDKELSKAELRKKTSIARSTVVKMVNNEYVSMDVLVRICIALECGLDDIVEIEREDGGKQNG